MYLPFYIAFVRDVMDVFCAILAVFIIFPSRVLNLSSSFFFIPCLLTRDLESLELPVFSAKAHTDIINAVDGCGGLGIGGGALEIVTGSRDGTCCLSCYKVQDVAWLVV